MMACKSDKSIRLYVIFNIASYMLDNSHFYDFNFSLLVPRVTLHFFHFIHCISLGVISFSFHSYTSLFYLFMYDTFFFYDFKATNIVYFILCMTHLFYDFKAPNKDVNTFYNYLMLFMINSCYIHMFI